jgi:lipoprotein-releasing system permease protein
MMIRPFVFALALRFVRARRDDRFVSFLNATSVMGIALGVAVLMTVMAVMNGFARDIKAQWLSHTPHMVIQTPSRSLTVLEKQRLDGLSSAFSGGIKATSPWIQSEALMTYQQHVMPMVLLGVDPDRMPEFFKRSFASSAALNQLKAGSFSVLISPYLAAELGLHVADKLTLVVPKVKHSILGVVPRFRQVRIAGFLSPEDYSYRSAVVLASADARVLLDQKTSAVRLWLADPEQANLVGSRLSDLFGADYKISSWIDTHQLFFKALSLEKNMMALVLSLIVVIATFYLITALVMLVRDKRSDIAVLLTMGLSRRRIMFVFLLQGLMVTCAALLLGLVLGYLLVMHVNGVIHGVEWLLGVRLFEPAVYGLSYLPVQLMWHDVFGMALAVLFLSCLASFYPACRAAGVRPAEVLRYV